MSAKPPNLEEFFLQAAQDAAQAARAVHALRSDVKTLTAQIRQLGKERETQLRTVQRSLGALATAIARQPSVDAQLLSGDLAGLARAMKPADEHAGLAIEKLAGAVERAGASRQSEGRTA